MNSFDLFDTLIFRSCYEPEKIFLIIEKRKGIKNFTIIRQKLQENIFFNTYRSLQKHYNWTNKMTYEMMNYEISVEKEHIFPIWNMINKVKEDDIIVSDMYLPENVIKDILEKYNLKNKLYLSYSGKYDGTIWNSIKKDGYNINTHYGDNIHSDINIPRKYGINTVHITQSFFTETEKKMPRDIGLCIRYTRLLSPFTNKIFQNIYNDICLNNIPILLYFSQYINEFVKKNNFDTILFSSRDCIYLYFIYKKLYPFSSVNLYIFFTSRYCYNTPNKEYDTYVNSLLGNKTLVVDLHGSGTSFTNYFKENPTVHLLFFNGTEVIVKSKYVSCILNNTKIGHLVESLNLVRFGSVYSFKDSMPCFGESEFPSYMIEPYESVINNLLIYIETFYKNTNFMYNPNIFDFKNLYLNNFFKNQKLDNTDVCKITDYLKFRQIFNISYKDDLLINNFSSIKTLDTSMIQSKIIHHSKETQRRKNIEKILKELDITKYQFIEPYLPNDFNPEYLKNMLGVSAMPKNISLSQYSHLLTYLTILDSNETDELFIIEDDIKGIYENDVIKKMINYILNSHPLDADMIFLEFCYENCDNFVKTFTKLKKPYCSSFIYYPTEKSRKKIINAFLEYVQKNGVSATDNILAILIEQQKINAYSHTPIFTKDHTLGSDIEGSENIFCNNKNVINIYNDLFINKNDSNKYSSVTLNLIIKLIFIIIICILIIGLFLIIKTKTKTK